MKIKCWIKDSGTHIIDIPREFRKAEAAGTHNCIDIYEKEVWADVRLRLNDGLYTRIETIPPEVKPLTLEELLQCNGMPIWCRLLGGDGLPRDKDHEEWVIVGKIDTKLRSSTTFQLYPGNGSSWICSDMLYGKHWLAYRQRPQY